MSRQEDFDTQSDKYVEMRKSFGVNDPYALKEIGEAHYQGAEYGYQYVRKNLWYDAQGGNVPEYGREVIVIGRDGKVFYGHRPDPDEVTMVEGKPYHAKTYDKNGWNWPDIALWLDVEIPHETVDKIATEYYKEKWTEKNKLKTSRKR